MRPCAQRAATWSKRGRSDRTACAVGPGPGACPLAGADRGCRSSQDEPDRMIEPVPTRQALGSGGMRTSSPRPPVAPARPMSPLGLGWRRGRRGEGKGQMSQRLLRRPCQGRTQKGMLRQARNTGSTPAHRCLPGKVTLPVPDQVLSGASPDRFGRPKALRQALPRRVLPQSQGSSGQASSAAVPALQG